MTLDLRLFSFFLLSAITSGLYADEWLSKIDKKYKSRDSARYSIIETAKSRCRIGCYLNGRWTKDTYDLLRVVINNDPKFAPVYIELSRVILDSGLLSNEKYDPNALVLAENELNKALLIESIYDYAFALRGYVRMYQENYIGAESDFASARALGSSYPYLYVFENKLLALRGKYNAAIYSSIQQLESIKSPDVAAGFINNIILAYESTYMDHSQEIDRCYNRLVAIRPNVAIFFGNYSQFKLLHFGDFDSALIYAERAASLNSYPGMDYNIASALYIKWAALSDDSNRLEEAEFAYGSAKAKYIRSGDVIDNLMFNAKLRNFREALIRREGENYNN